MIKRNSIVHSMRESLKKETRAGRKKGDSRRKEDLVKYGDD